MDTNITFRIDSDVKAKMATICSELGMSTSTAFNLFANAFVRAKGMPFPIILQEKAEPMTQERMLADAEAFLDEFSEDYRRLAE